MAKLNVSDLMNTLKEDVDQLIINTKMLQKLDKKLLLTSPSPERWNVAQVLEHLNAYNRFYLDAIQVSLDNSSKSSASKYSPGIFGDYFTKMMSPKDGGVIKNKMKAMKEYVFDKDLNIDEVINEFIKGQNRLVDLLVLAEKYDVGRIKVPVSISKFIKLKLGDTFRFVIAHQKRHFIQIENTVRIVAAR